MNIGITQRAFEHKGQVYDALDREWYNFFSEHAGYKIKAIPSVKSIDLDKVAKNIDVLVISGGNDISPRGINEWRLIDKMRDLDKPIIGICHGAFLMTYKDHGKVEPIKHHNGSNHIVWYKGYDRLVNSHHDLGIKRVPEGAEILCEADDGSVECWIKGKSAAIAWHPERTEDNWMPLEVEALVAIK